MFTFSCPDPNSSNETCKATRYNGVQTEHLLSTTPLLFIQYLSLLFQACIVQQYIPTAIFKDLVTYVLKKGKNPKDCESLKPITVCSTIGELFAKLIFKEINAWCDHGDKQFGFYARTTLLADFRPLKMLKTFQLTFQRRLIPLSPHMLFFLY